MGDSMLTNRETGPDQFFLAWERPDLHFALESAPGSCVWSESHDFITSNVRRKDLFTLYPTVLYHCFPISSVSAMTRMTPSSQTSRPTLTPYNSRTFRSLPSPLPTPQSFPKFTTHDQKKFRRKDALSALSWGRIPATSKWRMNQAGRTDYPSNWIHAVKTVFTKTSRALQTHRAQRFFFKLRVTDLTCISLKTHKRTRRRTCTRTRACTHTPVICTQSLSGTAYFPSQGSPWQAVHAPFS